MAQQSNEAMRTTKMLASDQASFSAGTDFGAHGGKGSP
jgi:hypothetical protein